MGASLHHILQLDSAANIPAPSTTVRNRRKYLLPMRESTPQRTSRPMDSDITPTSWLLENSNWNKKANGGKVSWLVGSSFPNRTQICTRNNHLRIQTANAVKSQHLIFLTVDSKAWAQKSKSANLANLGLLVTMAELWPKRFRTMSTKFYRVTHVQLHRATREAQKEGLRIRVWTQRWATKAIIEMFQTASPRNTPRTQPKCWIAE